MIRRAIPLIFLILTVLSGLPILVSVYAVHKNPPPVLVCFEAVGIDPHGVSHVAYFYRLPRAEKLAAAWIAMGWAEVTVAPC
jgi:hypothetical protein